MQTLHAHSQYLTYSVRVLPFLFLRACIALAPSHFRFLLALPFVLFRCFHFLGDSFFWCSFLYDLMMDACCMWPARFDKIPPFLFLSSNVFFVSFSGHTVQPSQTGRCTVISPFSPLDHEAQEKDA